MKQISDYFYKAVWGLTGNSLNTGDYIQNLILQLLLEPFTYHADDPIKYQKDTDIQEEPQYEMLHDKQNMIDTIVYEIDNHIKVQVAIPANTNVYNLRVFHHDNQLIIKGWPDGYDKVIGLEGNPAMHCATVAYKRCMLEIIIPKCTE